MSKLTILAGDFPVGAGRFTIRNFTLPGDKDHYLCETVSANQISAITPATEKLLMLLDTDEEAKKLFEETKEKQTFFMVKLKDGRRFVAGTDEQTLKKILNAVKREVETAMDETPSAA